MQVTVVQATHPLALGGDLPTAVTLLLTTPGGTPCLLGPATPSRPDSRLNQNARSGRWRPEP